jgi:hypothetical protein
VCATYSTLECCYLCWLFVCSLFDLCFVRLPYFLTKKGQTILDQGVGGHRAALGAPIKRFLNTFIVGRTQGVNNSASHNTVNPNSTPSAIASVRVSAMPIVPALAQSNSGSASHTANANSSARATTSETPSASINIATASAMPHINFMEGLWSAEELVARFCDWGQQMALAGFCAELATAQSSGHLLASRLIHTIHNTIGRSPKEVGPPSVPNSLSTPQRRRPLSFIETNYPAVSSPRRFPPPWTIEELDACFVVMDSAGQKLAYIFFEEVASLLRRCVRSAPNCQSARS